MIVRGGIKSMGKSDLSTDCEVIHLDTVTEARAVMPCDEEIFDLSELFKAFADSTRVKILWALDTHEMCVCDIAALLNMTKSAVSHQLRYLREADLIKNRRDGKVVFYTLADEHVREIFEKAFEHIKEDK